MRAKYIAIFIVGAAVQFAALKTVWLQGFDTGADVSLCVGWHMIEGSEIAKGKKACKRAEVEFNSPLTTIFRRRG